MGEREIEKEEGERGRHRKKRRGERENNDSIPHWRGKIRYTDKKSRKMVERKRDEREREIEHQSS